MDKLRGAKARSLRSVPAPAAVPATSLPDAESDEAAPQPVIVLGEDAPAAAATVESSTISVSRVPARAPSPLAVTADTLLAPASNTVTSSRTKADHHGAQQSMQAVWEATEAAEVTSLRAILAATQAELQVAVRARADAEAGLRSAQDEAATLRDRVAGVAELRSHVENNMREFAHALALAQAEIADLTRERDAARREAQHARQSEATARSEAERMTADLAALQASVQRHANDEEALTRERDVLRAQVMKLQQVQQDAQRDDADVVAALTSKCESLTQQLEEHIRLSSTAENTAAVLTADLGKAREDEVAVQQDLDEARERVRGLEARVAADAAQHEAAVAELNAALEIERASLAAVHEQLAAESQRARGLEQLVEEERAAHERSAAAAREELLQEKDLHSDTRAQLRDVADSMNAVRDACQQLEAAAKERLAVCETEHVRAIREAQDRLSAEAARAVAAEARLEALLSQSSRRNFGVSESGSMAETEGESAAFRELRSTYMARLQAMDKQLADTVEQHSRDAAALRANTAAAVEAARREAHDVITKLKLELTQARQERDELQASISAELGDVRALVAQLTEQLVSLQTENATLRSQLSSVAEAPHGGPDVQHMPPSTHVVNEIQLLEDAARHEKRRADYAEGQYQQLLAVAQVLPQIDQRLHDLEAAYEQRVRDHAVEVHALQALLNTVRAEAEDAAARATAAESREASIQARLRAQLAAQENMLQSVAGEVVGLQADFLRVSAVATQQHVVREAAASRARSEAEDAVVDKLRADISSLRMHIERIERNARSLWPLIRGAEQLMTATRPTPSDPVAAAWVRTPRMAPDMSAAEWNLDDVHLHSITEHLYACPQMFHELEQRLLSAATAASKLSAAQNGMEADRRRLLLQLAERDEDVHRLTASVDELHAELNASLEQVAQLQQRAEVLEQAATAAKESARQQRRAATQAESEAARLRVQLDTLQHTSASAQAALRNKVITLLRARVVGEEASNTLHDAVSTEGALHDYDVPATSTVASRPARTMASPIDLSSPPPVASLTCAPGTNVREDRSVFSQPASDVMIGRPAPEPASAPTVAADAATHQHTDASATASAPPAIAHVTSSSGTAAPLGVTVTRRLSFAERLQRASSGALKAALAIEADDKTSQPRSSGGDEEVVLKAALTSTQHAVPVAMPGRNADASDMAVPARTMQPASEPSTAFAKTYPAPSQPVLKQEGAIGPGGQVIAADDPRLSLSRIYMQGYAASQRPSSPPKSRSPPPHMRRIATTHLPPHMTWRLTASMNGIDEGGDEEAVSAPAPPVVAPPPLVAMQAADESSNAAAPALPRATARVPPHLRRGVSLR